MTKPGATRGLTLSTSPLHNRKDHAMFTTEVGSRTNPLHVVSLTIAAVFVATIAVALAHNSFPHAWLVIGRL